MSNKVLVFYGTRFGQTARVADFIAEHLTNHGIETTVVNGDQAPRHIRITDYDGVIVGASVIRGRHQRCVRTFARRHRDMLDFMPSAFFSVSGSAASRDERGRRDAQRCIDKFLRETGWRPAMIESVGGAMAFTKYGPLLRWMLKLISKRNGGPTDTSRDHELTDWAQVRRFADAFANTLQHASVPLSTA